MYPTLFKIGHLTISTYGILVALAFLAAGWVASRGLQERGFDGEKAWRLMIYALIGGIVGAKLYYAILQGSTDSLLSRSGLVWYGGLIGGTIAALLGLRRLRLPLGVTADVMAPALPLGHAIGHVGCFFSGDSYGLPSSLPWAVAFPRGAPPTTAGNLRNVFGVSVPPEISDATLLQVHPTMLYSALALLGVFTALWLLRRRSFPSGTLFGLYLLLSGIERFLVEFVRAKDDRLLGALTTAQGIAALSIIGGAILLMILWRGRARNGRAAGSTDLAVARGAGP